MQLSGPLGHTAAHLAALIGDAKEIVRQISNGADLSQRTHKDGDTVALAAAGAGQRAVLREIMAVTDGWAFETNRQQENILHKAIRSGDMDTVNLVHSEYEKAGDSSISLYSDADIYGWTPAHVAADAGMHDALAILSDLDAPDLTDEPSIAPKAARVTPLMLAARRGDARCCKLLIRRGADVSFQGDHLGSVIFECPLTMAIRSGDPETLQVILDQNPRFPVNGNDGAAMAEYHAHLLAKAREGVEKGGEGAEKVLSSIIHHYREDREAAEQLARRQAAQARQGAAPDPTP